MVRQFSCNKNRLLISARWWMALLLILAATAPLLSAATTPEEQAPGRTMAQQAIKSQKLWITADHTRHEKLRQAFASGPEVTKACLSCHTEAAKQFHQTIHWTWMDPNSPKDVQLGKGGLSINNF